MSGYSPLKLIRNWILLMVAYHLPFDHAFAQKPVSHHYLYVACPGVRNYLEYSGHGLLAFEMDDGFRFLRRIPCKGLDEKGQPDNVKGIAVSRLTNCIYISTIHSLTSIDLKTEKIVWERFIEGGCDRLSISPDGATIYLPSFEADDWKVLDAKSGRELKRIIMHNRSHNTLYGGDGSKVYLEGLASNYLTIVNAKDHSIYHQTGPFANHVRPFTINARQTRCYVNVDSLLGFEIGDLQTGKKIKHIDVEGFNIGPVKRHGCPSHGIALSPDEKELWLADAFNESVHVFDLSGDGVLQTKTIKLSDQPGWITFSIDGRYALPSTGDIIDAQTKTILTRLHDETGAYVQSEKMMELVLRENELVESGDQFGIGRKSR